MGSDDDTSNYDKQQWQAEQAARDSAIEKQRDKERKTRERAARNAQRKLERLHRTLSENGEITDFENEFGQSVLERLSKFGSAFHDLEKGRPGDALSFAQKSVVAAMNKKVKALKKKPANPDDETDFDDGYERTADRWKNQNIADKASGQKKRSSFGSKKTPKFTPRVRHIEDDFDTSPDLTPPNLTPPEIMPKTPHEYIAETNVTPITIKADLAKAEAVKLAAGKDTVETLAPKRPFLRLVK